MTTSTHSPTRIVELLAAAFDEDAAIATLDQCVSRLQRARAAQAALAQLDAPDLRAALDLRATRSAGGAR